ncbi:MAG: alpha/beta fold hydrolase [Patescibacteria group bacterium]
MAAHRHTRRMLLITIIIGLFGLSVSSALAQGGSAPLPSSDPRVADPGLSAVSEPVQAVQQPLPGTTPPPSPTPQSAAQVAPTSALAPSQQAPAPVQSVTATATPATTVEMVPFIEQAAGAPAVAAPDTGVSIPLIIAIAVALAALGAYAFHRLRTKKKEPEKQEEDDRGCLDLKKRMERKLEELKDIRGRLTGKAKDAARGKVRHAVAGTAAGNLLAQAERLEKEYARLKMLFEQCIAGVSRKKRVFIVHNWSGTPEDGWYPWLHKALQKAGFKVYALSMPETDEPKIGAWVSHIAESVDTADKNTFFVGHSIGCQAILRYMEQLPRDAAVGKVALVAPWFTLTNVNAKEERAIAKPWLETPIDLEKVKDHTDHFFALFSDNDTYVPMSDRKLFEQRLGAASEVMSGMGHFTEEDGVRELPAVLDWLVK